MYAVWPGGGCLNPVQVNNNQETNRGSVSEIVDERTRFEMYYPPFAGAAKAGLGSIMVSLGVQSATADRANCGKLTSACSSRLLIAISAPTIRSTAFGHGEPRFRRIGHFVPCNAVVAMRAQREPRHSWAPQE